MLLSVLHVTIDEWRMSGVSSDVASTDLVAARHVWVGRHHDVAADVTAGGYGIDHRGVDRLHRGLEPGLDHAVERERLARGNAQAALGIRDGDGIELEPLRGRDHAAGDRKSPRLNSSP